MKAAIVTDKGVQFADAPKPAPKGNEILIKVKAASLNRADLAVGSGHSHGRIGGPGTIVGLECAGEVEAV
ncbi:MAG: quinone oxidoreductase, partial [Reyranella sp.]|nr:quinone oxidoreductase [Reyranella sp.]